MAFILFADEKVDIAVIEVSYLFYFIQQLSVTNLYQMILLIVLLLSLPPKESGVEVMNWGLVEAVIIGSDRNPN